MINNKSVILEFLDSLWNKKNISVIERVFDKKAIIESPLSITVGSKGKQQVIKEWFAGFPNIMYKPKEIKSRRNKVMISWECSGTHEGDFKGVRPTGKKISYNGVTLFNLESSMVKAYYADINTHSVLKQLGVSNRVQNQFFVSKDEDQLIRQVQTSHKNLDADEIRCMGLWMCNQSIKDTARIMDLSYYKIKKIRDLVKTKCHVVSGNDLKDLLVSENKLHFLYHLGMSQQIHSAHQASIN